MTATRHPYPSTEAHLAALTAALPDGYGLPVVAFPPGDRPFIAAAVRRDDLSDALRAVAALQDQAHLYVNTSAIADRRITELRARSQRGNSGDAAVVLAVFGDVDIAGPGHKSDKRLPADLDAALDVLADLPAPSLLVHSGGGLQPWWLLDEPWIITDDNRANAASLVDGWVRTIAHHAHRRGWEIDDGVGDLARILRLAGTFNHKTDPPVRSTLRDVGGWPPGGLLEHGWLWRPGVRYSHAELVAHLDPLPKPTKERPTTTPAPRSQRRTGGRLNILDAVNAAAWSDIWPPDWEYVGTTTVAGEVAELWRRPGASSDYSAKCWPDGGCQVWSDAIPGLDGGTGGRHSKADVLAWRLGLSLSELSRRIIAEARGVAA